LDKFENYFNIAKTGKTHGRVSMHGWLCTAMHSHAL